MFAFYKCKPHYAVFHPLIMLSFKMNSEKSLSDISLSTDDEDDENDNSRSELLPKFHPLSKRRANSLSDHCWKFGVHGFLVVMNTLFLAFTLSYHSKARRDCPGLIYCT
jgi:hypothetical protein